MMEPSIDRISRSLTSISAITYGHIERSFQVPIRTPKAGSPPAKRRMRREIAALQRRAPNPSNSIGFITVRTTTGEGIGD